MSAASLPRKGGGGRPPRRSYTALFSPHTAPVTRAYCILCSFSGGVMLLTAGSVLCHVIFRHPESGGRLLHTPPLALGVAFIIVGAAMILASVIVTWRCGIDDGDDGLEDESLHFCSEDQLDQLHQQHLQHQLLLQRLIEDQLCKEKQRREQLQCSCGDLRLSSTAAVRGSSCHSCCETTDRAAEEGRRKLKLSTNEGLQKFEGVTVSKKCSGDHRNACEVCAVHSSSINCSNCTQNAFDCEHYMMHACKGKPTKEYKHHCTCDYPYSACHGQSCCSRNTLGLNTHSAHHCSQSWRCRPALQGTESTPCQKLQQPQTALLSITKDSKWSKVSMSPSCSPEGGADAPRSSVTPLTATIATSPILSGCSSASPLRSVLKHNRQGDTSVTQAAGLLNQNSKIQPINQQKMPSKIIATADEICVVIDS